MSVSVVFTLSWPAGHPTYKYILQVSWDNSNPFLLYAAIYLQVSLLRGSSQNSFSRETGECKWCWVQCCLGDKLLWCTLSQFWVFFSEISVVSAFILSALLIMMHLYLSCLCIGEYFPGKVILCVCVCVCVTSLVFHYLFLGWLCAFPLVFTRNVKPYFS